MDHFTSPVVKDSPEPAHLQVRNRLLNLVQEGKLVAGEKLPSEPEIAALFEVSRMTANKAILSLVADGWLTRGKGKGTFVAMPTIRPHRIAVVISEDPVGAAEDYYFGSLYWAVQSACASLGVEVELTRIDRRIACSPDTGIIAIIPTESAVEDLVSAARGGSPIVLLGSSWSGYSLSSVDSDNVLGAALAVNHLADAGHSRLLFLGACPEDSNTVDRIRGFWMTVKSRASIDSDGCEEIVVETAFGYDESTEKAILELLNRDDRPTAIFAAGARLAMQALATVQRAGYQVPSDIAIVGYDDPEFLSLSYPAITTVSQPLKEMATRACEHLINKLSTRDPRSEKIVLEPSLITRGSTSLRGDVASEENKPS